MTDTALTQNIFDATRLFLQKVASRSQDQRDTIIAALYTAAGFHDGQLRKSGEPYIIHPLQVATLLAAAGCDTQTVTAGLLHDTLEDTTLTPEELEKRFGPEVYALVEAVTHQPMFSTKEFLEKVYAKARKDPRVAAIKIADQCGNHMNGSQLIFSLAKHREHLDEMEHFYLPQLAEIPDIPKDLVKLLAKVTKDSADHYQKRTN